MIHAKKLKIDKEKAKLWGVEEHPFFFLRCTVSVK